MRYAESGAGHSERQTPGLKKLLKKWSSRKKEYLSG